MGDTPKRKTFGLPKVTTDDPEDLDETASALEKPQVGQGHGSAQPRVVIVRRPSAPKKPAWD